MKSSEGDLKKIGHSLTLAISMAAVLLGSLPLAAQANHPPRPGHPSQGHPSHPGKPGNPGYPGYPGYPGHPIPHPGPKPIPHPVPHPAPRPVPYPVPHPIPRPIPHPRPVADLERVRDLILDARQLTYSRNTAAAGQKLRLANLELISLPHSSELVRLLQILDNMIEVLNDYRISDYEKIRIIDSCLPDALRALDNLQEDQYDDDFQIGLLRLEGVVQLVGQVQDDVLRNLVQRAVGKLAAVQAVLNQPDYRNDPDLERAATLAGVLAQALMDPQFPISERVRVTNDLAQELIQLVLRSHTFALEQNGGGIPGQLELLGVSGKFDKVITDTETVQVGRHRGRLSQLLLRARGNSLDIEQVVIEFGNGRIQVLGRAHLAEGRDMRVSLDGYNDRFVERVTIRGSTRGLSGSRARIEVIGIR